LIYAKPPFFDTFFDAKPEVAVKMCWHEISIRRQIEKTWHDNLTVTSGFASKIVSKKGGLA